MLKNQSDRAHGNGLPLAKRMRMWLGESDDATALVFKLLSGVYCLAHGSDQVLRVWLTLHNYWLNESDSPWKHSAIS
jgi:hypothetical protein